MALHIFSGSGAPSFTPSGIGHHYIDTTNKVSYISVGTSSSDDWETSDATAAIAAHEAAVDPHPQYTTSAEASAAAPVQSVAGKTGAVTLDKTDVGLANVDNTSDLNKPISTATQTALDGKANSSHTHDLSDLNQSGATTGQVVKWNGTAWAPANDDNSGTWGSITGTLSSQTDLQSALDAKQDEITGGNDRFVIKNSSGDVESSANYLINAYKGAAVTIDDEFADSESHSLNTALYRFIPTENSPATSLTASFVEADIDPDDSGFGVGSPGNALNLYSNFIRAQGTGDVGTVAFFNNSFAAGNGTDPIDFRGISYAYGFGEINSGVSVTGPIQGYGVQPLIKAGSSIDQTNSYFQGFYDTTTYEVASSWHTSFSATPTIFEIPSGKNFTGLNVNPSIDTIDDNGGVSNINVGGNLGTFGNNSYWHGLSVNPNIDSARYAVGVNVTMDNVDTYAGVAASKVIQDLTISADSPGSTQNGVTIEYVGGGTAGSEVVTLAGFAFEVEIEDGVSTAQNIADALNAFVSFSSNFTAAVTGTASNTQTVQGPVNLEGGENPGTKVAAYFDGNVEITGSLQFGGALSIGQLNAFQSQPMVNGGGQPTSVHSLVSNPTVADNTTVALADTLGINTAMLLTIGDNSTVTTGFIGASALALPAVVQLGDNSTIDRVAGASFALSLDAGAGAGSVIGNLDLCRSIAIPNGITTVTTMSGFRFDLPFGNPSTTAWGFYESPGVNNYMAGNLLIGGTPSSDDTVTNSSVALEIKSTEKCLVVSRMTTTQRDAMTAIDGMVIYNTTTERFQGHRNGSWVDFH